MPSRWSYATGFSASRSSTAITATAASPPNYGEQALVACLSQSGGAIDAHRPRPVVDRRPDVHPPARRVRLSGGGAGPMVAQSDRVATEPLATIGDCGGSVGAGASIEAASVRVG